MKRKKGSLLKTILKAVVSLGALILVFTKIEFGEVLTLFRSSKPGLLLLALFAFALSKALAAYRLNTYFRAMDIRITERQNLKLYLLGMYYNLFLPGGVGGDGYKIVILHKRTGARAGRIFWGVLIDRLNGVLALFFLAVILLYLTGLEAGFPYRSYAWAAIPLSAGAFGFIIYRYFPHFFRALPLATLLSLGVQGMQLLCAWLIYRAIGGSGQEVEVLFVFLISSIVAMVPVSIGGVGLRELTFLYGSRYLMLDAGISVALSLMFYIITAFVSLWGIYFGIRTRSVFGENGEAAAKSAEGG